MDMNKFAQEVFQASYSDEMRKQADEQSKLKEYGPALAALAALPFLAQKGSVMGRKAGLTSAPAIDWLLARARPEQSLFDYARNTVGARAGLAHAGTIGGALTGGALAYALYNKLKGAEGQP